MAGQEHQLYAQKSGIQLHRVVLIIRVNGLYDLRPLSRAAVLSTGLPDGLSSEISGGVYKNPI